VERYFKDYERVKLLLKRGLALAEISSAIGRGQSVVLQCVEITCHYNPACSKRQIWNAWLL
jgi:hypothetical protein